MDQQLQQMMLERVDEDGRLPCGQAFAIARQLDLEPIVVGVAANEAGIRISRCQLGLFGYGPKTEGKHKIVHAMDKVPERLAARLRAEAEVGLQSEGVEPGITCAGIWRAADGLDYPRMKAASAVEAMGLKVTRCQLGCFPRPWEG
jgi:hypothetical protein